MLCNSLECPSLWSSSILSSGSELFHILVMLPPCFPVNLFGSKIFSTENANRLGVDLSVPSMLAFESIERVKSTGQVFGIESVMLRVAKRGIFDVWLKKDRN